jgi:hypothetical protein
MLLVLPELKSYALLLIVMNVASPTIAKPVLAEAIFSALICLLWLW